MRAAAALDDLLMTAKFLQRSNDSFGLILGDARVRGVVHGGDGQENSLDAPQAGCQDGDVGDGAFVNV